MKKVLVFDLDDTLYDEIDFVKSGFREIAAYLGDNNFFDFMMKTFYKEGSGKIFDKLIEEFDLDISLGKLIEIYRFHYPDIGLPSESRDMLEELSEDFDLALITDGHYIMQKNKYRKLGLAKYIEYPVFTDLCHTAKPDKKVYRMVMDYFPEHETYVYVSDNPRKDFISPRKLGWKTIRYKNPVGIYKNIQNSAEHETDSRKTIPLLVKKVCG